jgi:uncharacterized membrane protein HdeD (DUF308 family)
MLRMMAKNWWAVVLRGVVAILFGILAWTWPGLTLGTLILAWGVYCLFDGILAVASAFSGSSGRPWWVLVIEGVASLAAAAIAFVLPGLSALVLLYLIAAWAIATGIFEIVEAIRLRKEIKGEFWLALAGVVSVLFGLMLIAAPGRGALAVVWIIGTYAMVFGVFLVALGFRLKGFKDLTSGLARPATARP